MTKGRTDVARRLREDYAVSVGFMSWIKEIFMLLFGWMFVE